MINSVPRLLRSFQDAIFDALFLFDNEDFHKTVGKGKSGLVAG